MLRFIHTQSNRHLLLLEALASFLDWGGLLGGSLLGGSLLDSLGGLLGDSLGGSLSSLLSDSLLWSSSYSSKLFRINV